MSKELNTIYSFKEQLSTAISGGGSEPSRFADLLIEKKLIDNSRAINILSTTGISCYDKTSRLISHVCSSIESCCEERSITVFSSFVEILRDPEKMGLKDLSEQLETHCKYVIPVKNSIKSTDKVRNFTPQLLGHV